MNVDLLRNVGSDLRYLRIASRPEADRDELRRASTTLRNLLIYDQIRTAWRQLRLEPKTPLIETTNVIPLAPDSDTEIQFAGAAKLPGFEIGGFALVTGKALSFEDMSAHIEKHKTLEDRKVSVRARGVISGVGDGVFRGGACPTPECGVAGGHRVHRYGGVCTLQP